MTVTPPDDDLGVSNQLRLVDTPTRVRASAKPARHARAVPRRSRRAARWSADWRLDAEARQIGRVGLAAARDALTRASDQTLSEAS
jgi:hypothetical protein